MSLMTETKLEKKLAKALEPFQQFIQTQTFSSKLLIVFTALSLIIANSLWAEEFSQITAVTLGFSVNGAIAGMSLLHWVNDGLMALFFFLLGMEIKREILVGEMSTPANLIPVLAAAIGGMVFPAIIFYLFNLDSPYVDGWGIPMATDTAFAVGILMLLGARVPPAAYAFLTGLAIIDDLGAILVIAVFYTDTLHWAYLGASLVAFAVLVAINYCGGRNPVYYAVFGILVWAMMLNSGVHATVAGILVAATVPARPKRDSGWLIKRLLTLTKRFDKIEQERNAQTPILASEEQHKIVKHVKTATDKATTPLYRWEIALEKPISLFVLPVFALLNAGILINADRLGGLVSNPLAQGIFFGLFVGKGLGIPLFAWLSIKCNWGVLPAGLTMRHVVGIGLLGGIGFTMSIFITTLGFGQDIESINIAKAAILFTSLLCGFSAWFWLKFFTGKVDATAVR
ncbi:Na+/H+ antiporter NhaA [Thalassomonas haliotis]|uniref:Na(+)/H(+) antiporter NhaA n=1 Tax=Thalassomonas haliotis TaxID=485448 RepID=A0ABY7VFQ7_9GAMM|nr:Na+/H+ antiporter NhaA [Thalassomonas haliotis]WDE12524.1 Na+/H+ antiporter NhaA [Thalassomonas haliotis]